MKNENKRSCAIDDEIIKNELDLLDDLIESKMKYRRVVQAAISKWVKDFQSGAIIINTVEDLRTLMQIDLELQKGMRFDSQLKRNRNGG